MRIILALAALVALAGCGGDEANNSAITNASPVAAASPPAGKAWVDVVEKTGEGWYRQGNPNAPIKLVEYGSRSCPTCGRFAAEGVEPMRAKYIATGQVSYEFRDFPVHTQDVGLSMMGRCTSAEAFFPILDQMYANQQVLNDPQKAELVNATASGQSGLEAATTWGYGLGVADFLKQRGIGDAQIRQCLTQAALETFSKQVEEGQAKGVDGTPSFFINDVKVEATGWGQLEPALRAAGAR